MKKTCKNCIHCDEHKREKWWQVTWCCKLHCQVRANANRQNCMHWKQSGK